MVNTLGKGAELEIRYLATKNLSFTFAGNLQHTEVIGPDQSFTYIPAYTVCGTNLACEINSFGGAYVVYNFNSLPGRSGNYADMAIPHSVDSLYANYITDDYAWGKVGLHGRCDLHVQDVGQRRERGGLSLLLPGERRRSSTSTARTSSTSTSITSSTSSTSSPTPTPI